MASKEEDDFLFKLDEMYKFYKRKIEDVDVAIWKKSFQGTSARHFCEGVDAHYNDEKRSSFFPKPGEIKKHIAQLKANHQSRQPYQAPQGQSEPEVAQAWITYMKFAYNFEAPGYNEHTSMDLDKALIIVNRVAKESLDKLRDRYELEETLVGRHEIKKERALVMESILDEHKISEYWA